MRTLSNDSVIEFNKLNSRNPILLLAELTFDGSTYYFVNNSESVDWGSQTYTPFPFVFDVIPGKTADTLPEVKLDIMNTLTMLEYLDDNDGLIRTDIALFIVHATESAGVWGISETKNAAFASRDAYPLRFLYTVIKTQVTSTTVSMTLGVPNYFQLPFPARLYRRDWCDFAYKGDLCWMEGRTVVSETDKCDHSYTNCKAHHTDQIAASPPVGVPFGGFPNIGKGSYRY